LEQSRFFIADSSFLSWMFPVAGAANEVTKQGNQEREEMDTDAEKNRKKYFAMLKTAVEEARIGSGKENPIGAALFERNGKLLGRGHNRRVRRAILPRMAKRMLFEKGRQRSYRGKIMVTTLAPCCIAVG